MFQYYFVLHNLYKIYFNNTTYYNIYINYFPISLYIIKFVENYSQYYIILSII
jgi:hypothetical protein